MIIFLVSFLIIGALLWHFWHMIQNVIGKYSGLFGVFCLFMPKQLNQVGNHHRQRVLVLLPLACIAVFFLFLGSSYLDIGG